MNGKKGGSMKKFDVNISVQVWRDLEIDAKDKEEAEKKAKEIMNNDWMEGEMEYNTMEIGFIHEIEKKTYKVVIEYKDGQKKNVTIVDYPTNIGIQYFTEIAKGFNPGVDILKLDWEIE